MNRHRFHHSSFRPRFSRRCASGSSEGDRYSSLIPPYREGEETYRRLVEFSPFGVLVHIEGRIVYLNPAGAKLLGAKDPAEVIGKSVFEFVHPDYRDLVLRRLSQKEALEIPPAEEKLIRLDGHVIDADVSALRISHLGRPAVLVVFRDITAHKQRELALREAEEKFRRLFEASLDTITINRMSDGRYIDVSDEFLRVTGYARDEVLGKTPDELSMWANPGDLKSVIAALGEKGFIRNLDAAFRKKDGATIPALFSAVVTNIGGEPCSISITRDITELKQMEAELVIARDQALESSRLKSAFLSNMSHEIRTPLNVITGYCSLLEDYFAERQAESEREFLEGISRAAARLIKTIHGTLDIAALESGTFPLRPKMIDLSETIRDAVKPFERLARNRGLTFSTAIQVTEPRLLFDEYCLQEALTHLVDNAVKFTEHGGVSIRLCRSVSGELFLEIGDTGVGIDAAFLSKLFTPFSQEESGYTRRFEGPGLGLALAKRFLELNGALLIVQSVKGFGSTFTVRFPRERAVIPSTRG